MIKPAQTHRLRNSALLALAVGVMIILGSSVSIALLERAESEPQVEGHHHDASDPVNIEVDSQRLVAVAQTTDGLKLELMTAESNIGLCREVIVTRDSQILGQFGSCGITDPDTNATINGGTGGVLVDEEFRIFAYGITGAPVAAGIIELSDARTINVVPGGGGWLTDLGRVDLDNPAYPDAEFMSDMTPELIRVDLTLNR
jgi:hypothetical protein